MRKYALVLLITLVGMTVVYLYLMNHIKNSVVTSTPSETNYTLSEDSITTNGLNQYKNVGLKYSFEYPLQSKIFKCQGMPCVGIDDFTIRTEPLEFNVSKNLNEMGSLLSEDFYCSAGGPMGNKDCVNDKFEKYTNSNGEVGYKLYRTVTISEWNQTTQKYDTTKYADYAYIFRIENPDYPSILFAVDKPSDINRTSLDKVINTFKTL